MIITEIIKDYLINKIEEVKTLEELEIIEDYFFTEIEFDKDSYTIASLLALKKLKFTSSLI